MQVYNNIFALFTPQSKQALPTDKTVGFRPGLNKPAGGLQSRRVAQQRCGYNEYKTRLEKALYALNIAIDDSIQIRGLLARPFTKSRLPK